MKPENVLEIMSRHRENVGRCAYLRVEISETEKAIEAAKATAIEDAAVPGAQRLTGMPRGGKISNPTEQVAIMFAAGKNPEWIQAMTDDLADMRREYNIRFANARRVEAWLGSLSARERWVVTGQVIDGMTWRELMREFEQKFGEPRTKRNLQALKMRAMEKVYRVAG